MPTNKPTIRNYQEALNYLGDRVFAKIGHNTYLQKIQTDWDSEQPTITVRLYSTEVVTFKPDGSIIIRTGNFGTTTTRNRINLHIPDCVRVFQRDYTQLVSVNGVVKDFTGDFVIHPSDYEMSKAA